MNIQNIKEDWGDFYTYSDEKKWYCIPRWKYTWGVVDFNNVDENFQAEMEAEIYSIDNKKKTK